MLVTGDVRSVAERVARAAGIRDVHAQTTPVEKAEIVRAARADGARVAFVGDGLNDGPALAAADLGIAVDSATDLAAECARIVLVVGGVERVGEALAIARATRRRMRQNLTWALVYNVLAIPAAALGWISPSLAAAAMAASSLSIVGNSLRADQDSGAKHARRARTG
jgi:Cu+-exporting ATPase